jgi:MFS family permease
MPKPARPAFLGASLVASSASPSIAPLGPIVRILVILIAAIGFLFDTYELLMFPVIGSNAVGELIIVNKDKDAPPASWITELGFNGVTADTKRGIPPTSPQVGAWAGRMLWIAALCGGVFGMLGGLLIDRMGRKTIMIASILAYSLSPVAAAFSTDLWHLVLFRCTTFIGVCVEMVAAVTWLAELFEDKRTRELVIGWTLAAASLGGILVSEAYSHIIELVRSGSMPTLPFPEGHVATNVAWRFTLLTGLIPGAAILFMIPFVPESSVWRQKKRDGTLRRPGFGELFSPMLRKTTIVTTILSACGYAAAFGAIQMTPLQIVPGLPEIAAKKGAAEKGLAEAKANLEKTTKGTPDFAAAKEQLETAQATKVASDQDLQGKRANIQKWQEYGGLLGRILLAVLLLWVSSRTLIRLFLIPGIFLLPFTYFHLVHADYDTFAIAIFFCGLFTVAQFSFLSEFLPRVFPLHLRGTGGSFATNFGGRMIGTMAATLNTEVLSKMFTDIPSQPMRVAAAAGVIGAAAFVIAFIATFFLPAPHVEVEKQEKIFGPGEALHEPKLETVD